MYQHILIPTDGSELAKHAVTNGLSLAKSLGAKVTAIVVEEPFDWLGVSETKAPRALEEFDKYMEQVKKHAASVLDRVANAAKQAGVPCDTVQVENAQPYQAIIATAGDRGCDLIVMASHGRSGLSAMVLGSVTNKVLTHTKTPVLVCHWMRAPFAWHAMKLVTEYLQEAVKFEKMAAEETTNLELKASFLKQAQASRSLAERAKELEARSD